jgi:hypothetical protein
LLVAITERRSRADIDRLADVLGEAILAERRLPHGGAHPDGRRQAEGNAERAVEVGVRT